MSRILLLSYYFPPIGGAGAQRPARFARHLSDFGHDVVVVSGPGSSGGRWTPADESLLDEIPTSVAVLRAPGPEPESRRSAAARWLGLESAWGRWWIDGAVGTGERAGRVDAIFTVMSPYQSAVASNRLAAALQAPWIADLGDPWALDEMTVYPTRLHRARERGEMRKQLAGSAAIVTTTPEAAGRVRQSFPTLAGRPITSISLGYDSADFAGGVIDRQDGTFRIVHTGYLHTDLGRQQRGASRLRRLLGGSAKGVDIHTRSHVYLLEALARLIARDSSLASAIEVHLAGVLSEVDREIAARSEAVRLRDYLPHADSVELIRSADLLFLPMQRLPPGVRSTMVPGKTYEYLASRRPILAAVPAGDARDILTEAGNAHICEPDDVGGLMAAIQTEFERWRRNEPPRAPAPELLRRFDYLHLTHEVEALIERVVAPR